MFDFEVFVGPAIVLLGMFIGLLGFAIWGTRAVRESAPLPELAPLVDGGEDLEAAESLAELELPDLEGEPGIPGISGISGVEEETPGVNLEKTAEFEQPLTSVNTVASFSQSFWEGQEVAAPSGAGQSDYNEAIDRIQAGLNAADAVEFNKNAGDADAMAAANVLEALRHGVVAADSAANKAADKGKASEEVSGEEISSHEVAGEKISSEEAAGDKPVDSVDDVDSVENEAEIAIETEIDDEATRMLSQEEIRAIAGEPETDLNKAEIAEFADKAGHKAVEETSVSETDSEIDSEIDKEATMVLRALEAESRQEEQLADVSGINDLANNMEETVIMKKLPVDEPAAPAPNLQRMPPGASGIAMAGSFGFVNNQANGLASSVGLKPMPDLSSLTQEEAGDTLLPETPIPFGPKMAWLAIPGFKPSEVIAALRLDDVQTTNWSRGLQEAYADNNLVYVSPSLGGWVLVIGKTLWERAEMNRSAENISWLKEICRKFGNACFFSTMRGLGNHGWVGIRDGQIFRAYGYSGELQELIWLVGEPTEEEIAINPAFITEVREKYQPGFRPVIPDEKLVLAVAAAWSVDPGFRRRQYPADFGFLGYLN